MQVGRPLISISLYMDKPIIYQLLPRLWGNVGSENHKNGTLEENGTGKFSSIDAESLDYIKWLGCSHVWLTGVIRHATATSSAGCIPSSSQIVKGRAGSPYAIVDYYDVNPYLADDPSKRMEEFEALLDRIHGAGLKVVMDFVPNHVSRDYGRVEPTPGHPVLGQDDDTSVHWAAENDFFYYPGQALTLPTQPAEGEQPYMEYPAKATGNNFTASPQINDWYETIKINYCDTHTGTWDKMLDALHFWAEKGVDAFRCDMVELVPCSFLTWLIKNMKRDFPEIVFIAEAYQKDTYNKYIRDVGFDYLYDKSGLYDTLRMIVDKNARDNGMPVEPWQSAEGITRNWQNLGDLQPYMLNFLENHDEQRIASDFSTGDGAKGIAALCVALFMNRAPFMLYMGQELGEPGMEEAGFSGRDGRTTIFDWWRVPSVQKLHALVHSRLYEAIEKGTADQAALDAAGISAHEAEIFSKYAKSLRFAARDNAVRKGMFYDLCYCNYGSDGFDPKRHYAFLRDHGDETLLFVANFSATEAQMQITIPQHAFEWMELPVTKMLGPDTKIRVNIPPFDAIMFRLSGE